jgi:hypothetical protein
MHQSENELPRVVCKRMPLSLVHCAIDNEFRRVTPLKGGHLRNCNDKLAKTFIQPIIPVSGTSRTKLGEPQALKEAFHQATDRQTNRNRNQTIIVPLLSVLYRSGWLTAFVTILLTRVRSSYIGNDLVQVLKFIEKIIFFVAVLVSNETAMPVID